MLQIILEHTIVAITGLALLLYLGAGLSMWLPVSLAPFRWLIAPWVGFGLLAIITQFLTNAPFSFTSPQCAVMALGLATAANGVAVRGLLRTGRTPSGPRSEVPYKWLVLISLSLFVLSVLPIWSYGYSNVIGENWDVEMYLALGEYLKSYAQSNLGAAPPNPVLLTLLVPPVSERTQAFSYFQATLGSILPLDGLHTLVPGLALIRALSVPAVYVFFSVGLRLRPRTALLASAAIGINAFLLWITYNAFAMQLPSFGLLPLALATTLLTTDVGRNVGSTGHASWLTALWMGFFLGALAVAYHPALTAYAAMAGPPVVVAAWMCLKDRKFGVLWRVLRALVLAGAVGFALSLVSQLMSLRGFLAQYNEQSGGMGLEKFTFPGDAFGFSLSFRSLLPIDPGRPIMSMASRAYDLTGWVALFATVGLIALYLYKISLERKSGERTNRTWQVWAVLAGAIGYSVVFVTVLDYPYGWFKALSFIAPVVVGLAAGGVEQVFQADRLRKVAPIGTVAMLALMLVTTVLTVGLYWRWPVRFSQEMVEADSLRSWISSAAPGARDVYIAESPGMRSLGRLSQGLLSYYLRDAELYGHIQSAYSEVDRDRPDGVYDYTVLRTGDNPAEYGMGNGRLAWHNSLLSLYMLPAEGRRDLYHKNYRQDSSYPQVSATQPLTLVVVPETLQVQSQASGDLPRTSNAQLSPRQVTLGLASATTSTLHLQFRDASAATQIVTTTVPPGYTAYRTGIIMAPSLMNLSLAPAQEAQGDVYLRWAHLDSYVGESDPTSGLTRDGNGLLLWLRSEQLGGSQVGQRVRIDLDYRNDRPGAVSQTLSIDIYGRGGDNAPHFGYWNFDVPDGGSLSGVLDLDLINKSLTVQSGPAEVTGLFKGETGDGEYVASLLVYVNGKVHETFNDIFTFTIDGGAISSFKPRKLPPQFR